MASAASPRKNLSLGVGQWNHYYVRAINGEVRLWVNGEEVSGGTECHPATGLLCAWSRKGRRSSLKDCGFGNSPLTPRLPGHVSLSRTSRRKPRQFFGTRLSPPKQVMPGLEFTL